MVEHPFHFSSHVLLWHTLSRLAQLYRALGPSYDAAAEETGALAAKIRQTALRHFIVIDEVNGQPILAYLTDGNGQHTLPRRKRHSYNLRANMGLSEVCR